MEKVYKSFILTGNTLIIITNQGDPLIKVPATAQDVQALREVQTEEELYEFVVSKDYIVEAQAIKDKRKKDEAEAQAIRDRFQILKNSGWFEVKDNTVYFKGINRSLPPLLVDHFVRAFQKRQAAFEENDDERFERYNTILLALKRFQMWAFANPRAEVADELYGFLKKNTMRLTKEGLIVALRNVVTVTGMDTSLVSFISESYNKMKAAFWLWRKDPEQYNVYEKDNKYKLFRLLDEVDPSYTYIGGLGHLYRNLPELSQNRYTDARTGKFDIRIGQKVSMDPAKCSWSTVDCGEAGLHFTMDEIHYVGCGDTSVMMLINPMKIVGIGESKGRCYEYLPFMTVNRKEATQILRKKEFDTMQLDIKYAEEELENLEATIRKGFVDEASKYSFNIPTFTSEEVKAIVNGLVDIKDRIVNIS